MEPAASIIAVTTPSARDRLLDATITLVRRNGYSATSVDALCAAAGVTKGAFFHHFPSKEALAVAAAARWSDNAEALFAAAGYRSAADPLGRILAYVDFRLSLIAGGIPDFSCFAGTLAQEAYNSHPALRTAAGASVTGHAATLEADFAAAIAAHGITGVTARSLALHTQTVLQGGFVVAKALGDPDAARDSVIHLRRYIELLFGASSPRRGD